ncbi:hypothetical protein BWQ96_06398 [Gracilariopsis chorda]|uniref:Uncharacterized protein n=1 Tax=Gracilariopsis chorda TaxID=448386 RepID=A0A2V3IP54_9FLOR|nr:hypothetical protein BWQ96_06398 [Gracilariopsis chorda]|eukprot:PXF43852.1 hypothetical protein BWQ96_06398 [Gracilariopsis chorda]
MADEPEVFNVAAQAEFLTGFVHSLPNRCHRFLGYGDKNALEAMDSIDTIGDAMRRANVSEEYITAVESIKDDVEIKAAISLLESSLEGKANVDRLAKNVPNPEPISKFVAFRDDPGVKREVLTGKTVDGETDLIRFSNYITGPGTTVGGAAVSMPLNLADMALAFNNVPLYRYLKLTKKLKEANRSIIRFVDDQEKAFKLFGRRPFEVHKPRKPYTIQLIRTVSGIVKEGLFVKDVFNARDAIYKRRFLALKDLEIETRKRKSRIRGQKRLALVGTGVQGVTSTYGIANGVVDIAAGDQMIDNAETRFKNGEID